MRRVLPTIWMLAIAGVFTARIAYPHHGFAVHYDLADQVRIEGRVHEVSLRNPHSVIRILVSGESGDDVIWTCETQAGSILKRKGITASRFGIGEPIIITGSHARRNPHGCEVGSIEFANGEMLTLRSTAGRARVEVNNVSSVSPQGSRTVFGTWLRDSFSGAPVTPGFLDLLTDAGRAASASYIGSRDDPTQKCSPVNPFRAWIAPGAPTVIRERNGHIEIQHEFMDTTRIIAMHGSPRPDRIQRSEMGYSTGRFDGQSLLIETTYFEAGVMITHVGEDGGVLHSEDLEMTEALSVTPDTGELKIQWAARDAQYFPQAITGELLLSPSELEIDRFDCVPQTAY